MPRDIKNDQHSPNNNIDSEPLYPICIPALSQFREASLHRLPHHDSLQLAATDRPRWLALHLIPTHGGHKSEQHILLQRTAWQMSGCSVLSITSTMSISDLGFRIFRTVTYTLGHNYYRRFWLIRRIKVSSKYSSVKGPELDTLRSSHHHFARSVRCSTV
jgi:hypothetical protein